MDKKQAQDTLQKVLKSRITRHVGLALAIFLVILFLSQYMLSCITKHGKELEVPDLTNITVAEAVDIAEECGLRVEIGDSVYIRRLGRGLVYSQNPPAGGKVKKGRRIILTINAVSPKKVSVPNLVGFSLRQAKAELQSRGLTLGKLTYVKDIATNNVLKQLWRGRVVEPGTSVETLSRIDLVLGLNPEENRTTVPNVVGLKYLRAVDVVHDYSLNIKRLIFDKGIKDYADSLDAVVYRQVPSGTDSSSESVHANMGDEVTLYLRKEEPKAE